MKNKSILIALFFLTLCTDALAQTKKVAVVTFYVVKQIGLKDFGGAAQAASMKLSDDPNFNMVPLLKTFHDQFFSDYSKSFPFELLPESEVVNNEAYKAYVPVGTATEGPLKDLQYCVPVDGYKVVLPLMGHENERNLLSIFKTDGVMKVYFDFDLVKVGFGGMGVVKVNAHANIALFNSAGDKVFSIKEDGRSKSVSPLVAGVPVMTTEKIIPMCQSAVEELMSELNKDLPKMIKKANAKL